jgi:hypothetical protein
VGFIALAAMIHCAKSVDSNPLLPSVLPQCRTSFGAITAASTSAPAASRPAKERECYKVGFVARDAATTLSLPSPWRCGNLRCRVRRRAAPQSATWAPGGATVAAASAAAQRPSGVEAAGAAHGDPPSLLPPARAGPTAATASIDATLRHRAHFLAARCAATLRCRARGRAAVPSPLTPVP